MIKIILIFLFAVLAIMTKAQTYPKQVFITTNDGDTVRGIIDFRTNEKLLRQCIYEKSRMKVSLGMVKYYGKRTALPFVRGGGFYTVHFSNEETRYYKSEKVLEAEWDIMEHFGLYLGGGIQMPLGKHYAQFHADWYKSLESSVTAEFAL